MGKQRSESGRLVRVNFYCPACKRKLAEVEVMRYKGDHASWHKHVHNVELDPAQVLKMIEMDRPPQNYLSPIWLWHSIQNGAS